MVSSFAAILLSGPPQEPKDLYGDVGMSNRGVACPWPSRWPIPCRTRRCRSSVLIEASLGKTWLEQLDRVARGVVKQDLPAADS